MRLQPRPKSEDWLDMKSSFVFLALCFLAFAATGDTVKDREGAVRKDRATLENDQRWIYNDYEKGFAEAKKSGKPLLVVLRCVPCLACAGIDSQVLMQETDLGPLLDQFVCVRVINANDLDLSLFQFDYDLSFSTLFFNGDGTVYGRYGSWRHQKDPQDKTTAGYKAALQTALAIHKGYPANKASLAGKQGAATPYKKAVEIPSLAGKYKAQLDWEGKVVQSCVHCHQIGEAFRAAARQQGKAMTSDLIYPWPAPETIGFTLAPDKPATVQSVVGGSVAHTAGLKAGDEMVAFQGQPLVSIADVSWVLHHAPDAGSLDAVVRRDGSEQNVKLVLPDGWRKKSDLSRRVTAWSLRGMATGGLLLEDLADEVRSERGLTPAQMALLVKYVGQYGIHAAGKNAGFKKDDVIVELDGISDRRSEGEMFGTLLQKHSPGEKVRARVLRGSEQVDLNLPIQ